MTVNFFFAATDLTVCSFEGKVYQVGQKYNSEDCELRCSCTENGTTVCEPMECRRGLRRKGKQRVVIRIFELD